MSAPLSDSTPYYLIDGHTKRLVRAYTYRQRNAARRMADKLDSQYGAVRYVLTFTLPHA